VPLLRLSYQVWKQAVKKHDAAGDEANEAMMRATLLRLAELPNVVGVKDSSGNLAQSLDLLRQRPEGFAVMTGDDALFYTMLAHGGDGGILASAHVATEAFVAVHERMAANDHHAARAVWARKRAQKAIRGLLHGDQRLLDQVLKELGKAALDKGYKRVMVIAEDYAFPYSQVQGFMTEYCRLGGKVPLKAWVPLGGKDYASVIARIPKDVDALVVVLGGADAVNFLNQYEQAGGDKPLVGGSITVSQDILNYKGKRRDSLVGTIAGAPIADAYEAPEFRAFVADYKKNFPDGYPSPSLFALVYYINMKAALDGLELVKGDLSDGQKKYREALTKMVLKTPVGDVRLDGNRQAIGTTFITEVAKDAKGGLYNKVLRKIDGVDQMLGQKKEDFQIGSRDVPNCP